MSSIFENTPSNYNFNSPTPGEITLLAANPNYNNGELDLALCKQIKSSGCNAAAAYIGNLAIKKSLENCNNAGLKLIFYNGSLKEDTETFINAFKSYPALGGWLLDSNLQIEDNSSDSRIYETYKNIIEIYDRESLDSMPPVFIGLTGDWEYDSEKQPIDSYTEYVAKFQQLFQPSFWPVAYFPDLYKRGTDPSQNEERQSTFYKDLLYYSQISRYTATPFWFFCRCQGFEGFKVKDGLYYNAPEPTWNSIRGTVFSALAHGAQGIYYWNYRRNPFLGYFSAPIDDNGYKTNTWDMLSTVNHEVGACNSIFCGCEMIDCRHLFRNISLDGVKILTHSMGPMDRIPEVASEKYSVLFSHIFNNGKNFLIIVCSPFVQIMDTNSSIPERTKIRLHFSKYWKIWRLEPASAGRLLETEQLDYNPDYALNPGDYLIFKWV